MATADGGGDGVRRPDSELWRALERLDKRLAKIERELEDEQMAEAVQAGVKAAMRGKIAVPAGLLPKLIFVLAAAVAVAGGIKGLIG